jgi:hypothetical protein
MLRVAVIEHPEVIEEALPHLGAWRIQAPSPTAWIVA